VRPARHGDETLGRRPGSDPSPTFWLRELPADRDIADKRALAAEPETPERRSVDRAGERPPRRNERDVDRELAVAGDELLRAVQRIDEQEPGADPD